MPEFRTRRRVRHSADNMFALVADVAKYPEFLPLCTGLKVRRRDTKDDGLEVLVANMSVGYRMIHETFTTRVTLDRPNLSVLVEYLSGPFSHLENTWKFRPIDAHACDVDFYIHCGTLLHELRKQRGTSKYMILVPLFDLKFLNELAASAVGTSNRRHWPGFLTGSRGDGAEIWPASGFAPRRQYWTYWQGAKKRWRAKDQARARRGCEKRGLGKRCLTPWA